MVNFIYEGSKPNPQEWADMLEEYPIISGELKRLFNNVDILEPEYFTTEVLEDTYVYMGISPPRY